LILFLKLVFLRGQMRFYHSLFTIFISVYSTAGLSATQTAKQLNQPFTITQNLEVDNLNVSGIAFPYSFMALATDEGNELQLLSSKAQDTWQNHSIITLSNNPDEIDVEALAWQEPYLYVLGSHSAKRKKIKNNISQKDNIKRLSKTSLEPARQQVFRVELDESGQVKSIHHLSLNDVLKSNEILAPFIGIPSKENGIDLEGLAINSKGRLLVGFRGPVLRDNIATVLQVKLDNKDFEVKSSKLLFLPTDGTGVRGLSEISPSQNTSKDNEFLVLTGAMGDQTLPYKVSIWNGKNALPGKKSKGSFTTLCQLPDNEITQKGKAEGIQFIHQKGNKIEFIIVFDGLKNGQPTYFECQKP